MSLQFRIALLIGAFVFLTSGVAGQSDADKGLDDAVAKLRKIRMTALSDAEKEAKAKQIDESWAYLVKNGAQGAARLKEEIRRIESSGETDDFFKLNAAVVLWKIGKLNEAEYIGSIWTSVPVATQYNYVFYTAFEAAITQDPKAIPMLRAILKDNKGSIYVGAHAMRVGWPLSHEFIWGAYGTAGLEPLLQILKTSNDSTEIQSAMSLLTRAQYLPALEEIRTLSVDKREDVRLAAIRSLGQFGHPKDYEVLISALAATSPDAQFSAAYALYEFDDERAVPHLIPLLKATNDQVKLEVILALLHLLTPEAFAAAKDEAAKVSTPELKQFVERSITLRQEKLPKNYASLDRNAQAAILARIRNDKLAVPTPETIITNEQLKNALKEWKQKGRIYGSAFPSIGVEQIIAAATPNEIPAMIDTKSAFYKRLSDEALYETSDIDVAVKHVGRSRYRRGLGVTSRAELK